MGCKSRCRGRPRGSLVHAVLERIFREEEAARTPDRAAELYEALWNEVRDDAEFRPPGMEPEQEVAWLHDGQKLLRNYFKLEDPRVLNASRLEWWVEYELSDLHLRGIIDRLEETDDGILGAHGLQDRTESPESPGSSPRSSGCASTRWCAGAPSGSSPRRSGSSIWPIHRS